MSHISVMNSSGLLAAAAAICATGLLAVPVTAHAEPTIPLSPLPCTQYQFIGDFALSQSNGYRVEFTSTGPGAGGNATATALSGGGAMQGSVSGGISGRNVDFTIRWDSGPRGHYTGVVGDGDFAHGKTFDEANPGSSASWDATVPLGCAAPAATQSTPPAPTQPTFHRPAPAAQKTATVTNDVDVYDVKNVPDGAGTKIGMVSSGRQVQFVGNCAPDDWCNVIVPDMPGGKGWIWGNLQL